MSILSSKEQNTQKEMSGSPELNENGCVGTLLYNSQSCEYKTLCKHVREALSSGKFIPSDIVSMMNAIITLQPLTLKEMGCLKYESNKLIDCYIISSSDESEIMHFENEVYMSIILWPMHQFKLTSLVNSMF